MAGKATFSLRSSGKRTLSDTFMPPFISSEPKYVCERIYTFSSTSSSFCCNAILGQCFSSCALDCNAQFAPKQLQTLIDPAAAPLFAIFSFQFIAL